MMDIKAVTFVENDKFYEDFAKTYRTHNKGLFILAPSGSGKTHFCKGQEEPHWIDGDDLWYTAKAHPHGAWWEEDYSVIARIDARSDVITYEAKELGFWIMGASNQWLKPDAIVIPDWDTHVAQIKHREENNYDGGAKSDALDQVKGHIEIIEKWHTDYDVPKFNSIAEAVEFLTTQNN